MNYKDNKNNKNRTQNYFYMIGHISTTEKDIPSVK